MHFAVMFNRCFNEVPMIPRGTVVHMIDVNTEPGHISSYIPVTCGRIEVNTSHTRAYLSFFGTTFLLRCFDFPKLYSSKGFVFIVQACYWLAE